MSTRRAGRRGAAARAGRVRSRRGQSAGSGRPGGAVTAALLAAVLAVPPAAVGPAGLQGQAATAAAPAHRQSVASPLVEVRPSDPFRVPPPEALERRRVRLMEAVGEGVVVLRSADPKSIEGDYPQDSDFRQDNDFFYLTGLETPDSWLVLSRGPGGEAREVLFVPPRDPQEERWTGPKPGPEAAAARSGVEDVRLAPRLQESLTGEGGLLPGGAPLYLAADVREDPGFRQLAFDVEADVRELEPVLHARRLVKDAFEIEMLRRAIDITVGAQRAAMKAAEPGMYEYELEAIIEFNFRLGGAERVGFPGIVGSGPNSVVLHYDKNRRRMEEGDLVVMDIGAEYSYYTADVTRTIPVSGEFTDRQADIYELVLATQRAALDAVRPGVTVRDLELLARRYMRENSGDLCGPETCEAYFVHGLGHWLGMDVHDVGDYSTPLAPGMVLTIEPGIYLPEEALGVRIEDDVLVTETGYEVLSADAPREIEAVEALMAEDVRLYEQASPAAR